MSTNAALTTIPKLEEQWLTKILNPAFARVNKNVALLEGVGIFDAETITRIQARSEELRAYANFHLLGTLQGIEQQDRTRFKTS
jgi:hypothetical protein